MKKKLIKITSLLIIVILVFEIYMIAKNNKINYVVLGDGLAVGVNSYGNIEYSYSDFLKDYLKKKNRLRKYIKEHAKRNLKTNDILISLDYNTKLKKDLRESNLVTISIGANDILEEIDFKQLNINNISSIKSIIDKKMINISNTIKEIRNYAKEKIIIVGYYNPIPFLFNTSSNDLDNIFAYIDEKYFKISKVYDCKYIPIYQLFKSNKEYLSNPNDIHPNIKGYKEIADKIINQL